MTPRRIGFHARRIAKGLRAPDKAPAPKDRQDPPAETDVANRVNPGAVEERT